MEELLRLLRSNRESLAALRGIFEELLEVMDREEQLIAAYQLADFDRVVIEKDSLVQRAQLVEERRTTQMRRLCFLISFDARSRTPGLEEFRTVFQIYLDNIANLVDASTHSEIRVAFGDFMETAAELRGLHEIVNPRIYRNRVILEKVARNFGRSLEIMAAEGDATSRYTSKGKTVGALVEPGAGSSLRVRA